ncbi:MAG: PaaI family thioesterase [Megasphaera sp.]|uniref:PaaI family thioesterase n=1 Tax=Megasphaera sp. TaxID=2023260 RepID=UPI0025B8A59A|nr:PaaI family thioesterase [Megasphaera sp.]MCI7601150.1 PaaI family thioesterase [Megasphaera sp.]
MENERLEREIRRNPFDTFMAFHVEKAEPESTILTFENKGSKWDNPNGTMYGGVLYSMADSAMEAACAVCGKAVLTLDLGMNYLRPAFANTTIRAEARVIHNGRTTMVALCDFYDNDQRYLAHGKGTFFVTGAYVFDDERGHTDE